LSTPAVGGTIPYMSERKHAQRGRVSLLAASLMLVVVGLALNISGAAVAAEGRPVAQPASPTNVLQLPTATSTLIGGPTATPSRTPTTTPVLAEAIGEANLRSGPGLDFDLVGTLTVGNPVPVIGRSVNYPWLLVAWEDAPDGQAWVFEQLVRITGDITTVPIVDEPELPTIDPTQAIIQATATILLQTPGAAETATATAYFAPTGVYTQTPGGLEAAPGGPAATFTPPEPYYDPEVPSSDVASTQQRGPAPAVLIISLGMMGMLTLGLGLLRRL
jgi:hypothetical protein